MLIFKKEKHARKLVLNHLSEVHESLMESRNVLEEYIAGNLDSAREKAESVIRIESKADELERQIREVLLDGAFLPHIRSDVYRLVQAVDAVAGRGEDVAKFVVDESLQIPDEFQAALLELYGQSLNCFLELRKALRDYFKPKGIIENLHQHVARVCDLETEVDALESAITKRVFASGLEHSRKLHIGQLIRKIGNIADLAEDAADELEFAALKSVV